MAIEKKYIGIEIPPPEILIKSTARFLRRRSKRDNEFNPSTSPEDNQLVIKEGGTMNTTTTLILVGIYRPSSAGTALPTNIKKTGTIRWNSDIAFRVPSS